MNKLVIIGNGFDLAHGMKTRYQDFILWYYNSIIDKLRTDYGYTDFLITASKTYPTLNVKPAPLASTKEIIEFLRINDSILNLEFNHEFIEKLFVDCINNNWVDIEYEYFEYLKYLYSLLERDNFTNKPQVEEEVLKLNIHFEFLKKKLVEYLNTIEAAGFKKHPEIDRHFVEIFTGNTSPNSIMFLNFNYTSSIEGYLHPYSKSIYYVNSSFADL